MTLNSLHLGEPLSCLIIEHRAGEKTQALDTYRTRWRVIRDEKEVTVFIIFEANSYLNHFKFKQYFAYSSHFGIHILGINL